MDGIVILCVLFVYFYGRERTFYVANYSSSFLVLSILWKLSYPGNGSSDYRCAELAQVSVMATTSGFSVAIYALISSFLGNRLRAFVYKMEM